MNGHSKAPESALLDYPAAQSYLGNLSRSTLKTLVGKGELRPVKVGSRTLFRRNDLDALIKRKSREPAI